MRQQDIAALSTLAALKDKGFRLTKIRRLIVGAFFSDTTVPISAAELQLQLLASGTKANKTTVYRELEFLSAQGIIVEINAGDGRKRYELKRYGHHHHVLCLRCNTVECVTVENCALEEQLSGLKDFKVTGHTLNFFGLCAECR